MDATPQHPAVWIVERRATLATAAIEVLAERAGLAIGGRLDPERPEADGCRIGDIVISDPAMATRPLAWAGEMVQRLPDRRHMAVTHRHDDWFVLQVLRIGFAGFLLYSTPIDELARALITVATGESAVSGSIASNVAVRGARMSESEFWPGMNRGLTQRESQVLVGLSQGESTRGIAESLYLGEETVRSHLKSLYHKLGVSDRGAAVALAFRQGILSPDG